MGANIIVPIGQIKNFPRIGFRNANNFKDFSSFVRITKSIINKQKEILNKMQTDNKTYLARKEDIKPQWFVVDASNKILGRLATRLATILLGKHRPIYTPYVDTGDFVIVTNAEKIKVTGKKSIQKTYKTYSGYSDGLKYKPIKTMLEKTPEKVVYLAVKRMLPHNRLASQMIKKLKVYAGPQHPHQAQNPKILEI